MNKYVYVICNAGEYEGKAYSSPAAARHEVLKIIKANHTNEEIEEIANDYGYDTVEGFLSCVAIYPDYDEDFDINVETWDVND